MAQMTKIQEDSKTIIQANDDTIRTVTGYRLGDIETQQALVVPDHVEGVEIQTTLSSVGDKAIGSQDWMEFVISSITKTDAKWTQHATGMISVDFADADEMSNIAMTEAWKNL